MQICFCTWTTLALGKLSLQRKLPLPESLLGVCTLLIYLLDGRFFVQTLRYPVHSTIICTRVFGPSAVSTRGGPGNSETASSLWTSFAECSGPPQDTGMQRLSAASSFSPPFTVSSNKRISELSCLVFSFPFAAGRP